MRTRPSRRDLIHTGLGLSLGLALPTLSRAQIAPGKPIRLIVPYPPGGGTDALGRLLGAKLADAWKTNVIVENKTGASGILGNDYVAKATPDGTTILVGITALVQAPTLFARLPFDVLKDLQPLTAIARSSDLLVVPVGLPVTDFNSFVTWVKANPGKVNIGNYGNGTSSHIHAAMLNAQAGLDMNHIPYRGAGPLVTDLLGGQMQAAFVDATSIQPHLGSGKLRVLAVTGARPSPLAPDVPTLTSRGFQSFEPYGWFGLFVPMATPPAVSQQLSQAFIQIIGQPDVSARMVAMGLQPGGNSMAEFTNEVRADLTTWSRVIKAAHITLE